MLGETVKTRSKFKLTWTNWRSESDRMLFSKDAACCLPGTGIINARKHNGKHRSEGKHRFIADLEVKVRQVGRAGVEVAGARSSSFASRRGMQKHPGQGSGVRTAGMCWDGVTSIVLLRERSWRGLVGSSKSSGSRLILTTAPELRTRVIFPLKVLFNAHLNTS